MERHSSYVPERRSETEGLGMTKQFEDQIRETYQSKMSLGHVPTFKSYEEQLDYWYGTAWKGLTADMYKATVATTTTDYIVDVAGPTVTIWAANSPFVTAAWTVLPKTTYDTNSWVVETAEADSTVSGVAKDAGNLPTDSVPTVDRAANGIKVIPSTTSVSTAAQIEGRAGDAPEGDIWPYLKLSKGQNFIRAMDKHLLGDPDTVASNNLESLLRVCSSKGEEDNDLTAGDADIYGFDRSSATTFDAYVNRNSGTAANITLTMMDTAFQNIRPYGNPKVILTGLDTLRRLSTLLQSQEIYTTKNVSFNFNGMQTLSGAEAGFEVASYNGVPMLGDNNMLQTTISDVLFLNTDDLALQSAIPVTYQETTDPFINNGFKRRGLWLFAGELQCRRFNTQGKITYIK